MGNQKAAPSSGWGKSSSQSDTIKFQTHKVPIGRKPSLLDIFFLSHLEKVNNAETKQSLMADDAIVKLIYYKEELNEKPQLLRTRDWSLVMPYSLMEVIQENTNLMAVFKFYDPDYVANAIVEEMNQIVNDITPTRIIQTKKGIHCIS